MPNGKEWEQLPWWSPRKGWEAFKAQTGGLFPEPPPAPATAQLTPRTQQIMQRPEFQQQWGYTRPEEAVPTTEARRALEALAPTPAAPTAPWEQPTQMPTPTFPTEKPPEGYDWRWDSASMRYVLVPRPGAARISEAEIRKIELAEEEAEREQARWEQQQTWQREQQEAEERWREQQIELEQERMRWEQEEAERVERARLSAQPVSWLEYAAYTGETPAIQPWMQPLMPQQYQELGAGGAIPGWTAESATAMPELLRPSRQLQARMGPTALQQYGGYQQARTGIRPEEQEWRMWAAAPPGGGGRGLQWAR